MIDHLHRDSPGPGFVERPRSIAVQCRPGIFVDLRLECRFQRLVRIVGTEEVGVADKEALLVVVGVDEPAGDTLGAVGADFAGLGMENVYAVDGDLCIVASG